MFGIISKILLFAIGQKLTTANGEHHAGMKRELITLAVVGVIGLIFFAQGIAALLIAAFFAFSELAQLPAYYAALAVSGIALALAGIFAASARYLLCKNCPEKREFTDIRENLAGLDPRPLASAFLDGLLKKDNRHYYEDGEKRSCRR